jgi:hydrogenase nickel incorporation protein HypA/HybF
MLGEILHELSLAEGILHIVESAALREHFRRVATLQLEAAAFAGVDVHALRFALEAIAPGAVLEGAALQILQPEARAFCFDCAEQMSISARGDPCPRCGGYSLRPTAGTELRVLRLTVHDE